MRKYLYQKFLPDCNTENIDMAKLYSKYDECAQTIFVSELDSKVDTKHDLENLISNYSIHEPIVIINDRNAFSNQIIQNYSEKTLKSYIYWLRKMGYKCMWKSVNNICDTN